MVVADLELFITEVSSSCTLPGPSCHFNPCHSLYSGLHHLTMKTVPSLLALAPWTLPPMPPLVPLTPLTPLTSPDLNTINGQEEVIQQTFFTLGSIYCGQDLEGVEKECPYEREVDPSKFSPLLTAEPGTVAELHSFAREFKQRRARLGCTQTEVGRLYYTVLHCTVCTGGAGAGATVWACHLPGHCLQVRGPQHEGAQHVQAQAVMLTNRIDSTE